VDLRERSFQIFGANVLESLVPVEGGREYVARISGYVSAPRERRTNRDSQYFFVNRRFVRDKIVAAGLSEGFRSILPHGVYPVALLFLDIPVEEIDVNVHPAKTEVRFRRGEAVKDVIAEAVRSSLANAGIVSELDSRAESTAAPMGFRAPDGPITQQSAIEFLQPAEASEMPVDRENASLRNGSVTETESTDAAAAAGSPAGKLEALLEVTSTEFELLAETRAVTAEGPSIGAIEPIQLSEPATLPPVDSAARFARPAEVAHISSTKIQPLGQLHESFIIAVDDEGLLLIDQHVAHERILFDKFRKSETDRPIESQNLLLPETIDLTPAQSEAFRLIENDLESLGFGLMRLSGRTVAIKSVPTDLPPPEARNLFAEILDTIDAEKRGGAKTTLRDDIAASLACRAAVKINMKLTPEKMHWLIDRLLLTTSPTTCPHGRPVILRLSMKDIERGFHRT
jgi:DNA mismatch repair protein MutL